MRFLRWRGGLSFLEADSSGYASSMAEGWGGVYRSSLLILGLLAFAAHLCILAFTGVHTLGGTFSSNLAQLVLGAIALLAMLEARKRSSGFGRSVWSLAALSFGFYTVGQAIFTYIRLTGPPAPLRAAPGRPIPVLEGTDDPAQRARPRQ